MNVLKDISGERFVFSVGVTTMEKNKDMPWMCKAKYIYERMRHVLLKTEVPGCETRSSSFTWSLECTALASELA